MYEKRGTTMQRSELKFERGEILSKEMLQDMYQYPKIAIETYYDRYSDGILYGLEWKECNGGYHKIMPGALKYRGNIYFLSSAIDVECLLESEIEVDQNYKICFVEKKKQNVIPSQDIYQLELRALQSQEYQEKKERLFYYARVKCTNKKQLELFYNDSDDEIYGLFAANDGYEYQLPNWLVEKEFISLIKKKNEKHIFDYMILKDTSQGKGISVSFMKIYLQEAGFCFEFENTFSIKDIICYMKKAIKELQDTHKKKDNSIAIKYKNEEDGGLLM